jgi:hypothetical protein
MDKPTAEYKLEKRSVNNKLIFTEIHKFIEDGILTGQVLWGNDTHRESFVEIIGDCMEQVQMEGFIDQWNVISDLRNNTIADMDKGIYVMEIQYRQRNCLNTTRLIYTIKDLLIANIKDLIDFELKP